MQPINPDLESHLIKEGNRTGKNGGRRYFWGIFCSLILGQIVGTIPYLQFSAGDFEAIREGSVPANGLSRNWNFLLMLLPFVCSFLILYFYVRGVHKRPFRSVITPLRKINYGKFLYAFGIWMLILLVLEVIWYAGNPGNYILQFDLPKFAGLLLLSVLVLLIQTSYEEILFRGYGMQWLGRYMPYRIFPLLITSVSFGLMHIANPEVGALGYPVLIDYVVIGLALGLVSLLSDALEFAMGVHFANNLFAALFISYDSSVFQTDAVFQLKELNFSPVTQVSGIIAVIVFMLLVHFRYPLKPLRMLWTKDAVLNEKD
ncbi:MAG: CPBP family intramembrane metalloprotease [Sphingobacteriales bacterium]|nr:MAG: CPBP family intramembrane metalloprotease [Sphingobacteriales bacterium]